MSDELSELERLHEPSDRESEPTAASRKPIGMIAGIAVIVLGTGLLVWLGPTFNPRKPALSSAVHGGVRPKSALQGLENLDAAALRAKLPELIAALHADDEDVRLSACLALGKLGKDAVPELVPLLDGPDTGTRYYTVWALGQAGPAASEALPAVVKALKDADGEVRRKAVFALGRIKPEAAVGIPPLVAAFQDDDVDVRATAVEALAGYGKAAVPALVRVLQTQPGLEPRRLAVRALTQIGPDSLDALPLLRPLFLNDNSGLADEAAAALAALGKPAIPTLAQALQTAPTDRAAQVMRGLASPWAMLAAWHDYPGRHRRALQALGKIGPDALDQIVTALHSPNSDIREQAAGILGAIGFRDRRVVIPLVGAMRDPDAAVRQQAGWALGELAPDARTLVPGLTQAVRDDRPEVRFNAVSFLGQLGAAAVPPLVEALADPEKKIRNQAAQCLLALRVSDDLVLRALAPRLKDERAAARQAAVFVLPRCGTAALPELTVALQDTEAVVRQQAIQAFPKFPPDAKVILPVLTTALRDNDAYVRAEAVAALASYVGLRPDVSPLLRTAAHDPDANVRQTAVAALGRVGLPAVPALLQAMRDPEAKVWKKAIDAFLEMPVPDKVLRPVLLRALKSDDSNQRQGAAYAMARFGADAVQPLVDALQDPDAGVQWAAVDTLDTIGPAARKAVPALVQVAASKRTPKVRQGAVMALVTIHGFGDRQFRKDPAKAVPGLVELLDSPDAETRWGAVQTLAAIGPAARDAVAALTKLLDDRNLSVREAARYALQRVQGK